MVSGEVGGWGSEGEGERGIDFDGGYIVVLSILPGLYVCRA